MAPSPNGKPSLLAGLARILHLHQLPQPPGERSPSPAQTLSQSQPLSGEIAPVPLPPSSLRRTTASTPPEPARTSAPISSVKKGAVSTTPSIGKTLSPTMPGKSWPASTPLAATRTIHAGKGVIITDYDRILDLVKKHTTIKLDEIARVLSLKEELVAQELQTLEDNGLVDVKYPAFGEPLIYYKEPES